MTTSLRYNQHLDPVTSISLPHIKHFHLFASSSVTKEYHETVLPILVRFVCAPLSLFFHIHDILIVVVNATRSNAHDHHHSTAMALFEQTTIQILYTPRLLYDSSRKLTASRRHGKGGPPNLKRTPRESGTIGSRTKSRQRSRLGHRHQSVSRTRPLSPRISRVLRFSRDERCQCGSALGHECPACVGQGTIHLADFCCCTICLGHGYASPETDSFDFGR